MFQFFSCSLGGLSLGLSLCPVEIGFLFQTLDSYALRRPWAIRNPLELGRGVSLNDLPENDIPECLMALRRPARYRIRCKYVS